MLQLHQIEEGVLFLSCRPATANGSTPTHRLQSRIWRDVNVVFIVACSSRRASNRSLCSIPSFTHPRPRLSALSTPSERNYLFAAQEKYVDTGNASMTPLANFHPASDNSRTYDFSYHPDRSYWESPFYDHGPTSAGHSTPEDPSHPYWRMGDSPMTPAFSQYSGPSNSLIQPRSSFAAFNSPREEHRWQTAPRSMSFGQVEDLSHGYPHPYQSPVSMDYRRRPSELYPPSLQTSSESSKNNSTGEISTPPLTATVTSQPMGHFISPAWNALPGHSALSKAPEYSTWYSEPAPLAKVTEEEIGPTFNGGPGPVYTSVA